MTSVVDAVASCSRSVTGGLCFGSSVGYSSGEHVVSAVVGVSLSVDVVGSACE